MGSNDDEHATGIPTRTIHELYVSALEARREPIRSANDISDLAVDGAHQWLQSATLEYFEGLEYHLRTKDAVEDYWLGRAPADPKKHLDEGVAFLDAERHRSVLTRDQVEDLQERDDVRIYAIDEVEGGYYDVEYRRGVFGLHHLADSFDMRRATRDPQRGLLGARTDAVAEAELYDADLLRNAARALDQAADELNLLATVEDAPNITEIDEELIEEAKEWHEANTE